LSKVDKEFFIYDNFSYVPDDIVGDISYSFENLINDKTSKEDSLAASTPTDQKSISNNAGHLIGTSEQREQFTPELTRLVAESK